MIWLFLFVVSTLRSIRFSQMLFLEVETQTRKKIKILKIDRGYEYPSDWFKQFLEEALNDS